MFDFHFRRTPGRRVYLRLYPAGWLIFLLTLGTASLICALLQRITSSDVHVPMIFVLAVLIVSLSTDGYFYGILAAIVSVIGVNYAFTYLLLRTTKAFPASYAQFCPRTVMRSSPPPAVPRLCL